MSRGSRRPRRTHRRASGLLLEITARNEGSILEWANRDTELIAEYVRNEDSEIIDGQQFAFWKDAAASFLDFAVTEHCIEGLAMALKNSFCGYPEVCADGVFRENAGQPEEITDFIGLLQIKTANVDWRQIAEWLLSMAG